MPARSWQLRPSFATGCCPIVQHGCCSLDESSKLWLMTCGGRKVEVEALLVWSEFLQDLPQSAALQVRPRHEVGRVGEAEARPANVIMLR